MSSPQSSAAAAAAQLAEAPPEYFRARIEFAYRFLSGKGLEIGALNWPLEVPEHVEVTQVDRMSTAQLRAEYPEMADRPLPEIALIDNGETLEKVAADSQDFIIANHFLEHTADPIGTIETHLGKLKPGGILFYAVPDMRYTFDFRRQVTPLEHMIRDYEEGPEQSRREHYDEWAQLVVATEANRAEPGFPEWVETIARKLESEDHSIHTHVWTQSSFLALLLYCGERLGGGFEIEAHGRRELEVVVVLRKTGAWPSPAAASPTAPELEATIARLDAELLVTGRELQRVKSSPSWRFTEPLRAAKARLHRGR